MAFRIINSSLSPDRQKVVFCINMSMNLVALMAVTSLILEYGFYISPIQKYILHTLNTFIIGAFMAEVFLKISLGRFQLTALKNNIVELILILLFLLQILLLKRFIVHPGFFKFLKSINIVSITKGYIVLGQLFIGGSLFLKLIRASKTLSQLRLKPAQILILSYLAIILSGTFLLSLPRATYPGKELSFIDTLFTAVSATCVTGLTVVDIAQTFTFFGQLIVLFLIQIGGLGLMTFVSAFALILGRGMGIKERILMQDILDYNVMGQLGKLILTILLTTFIFESLGAFILYTQWVEEFQQVGKAIYYGIFHSISAFCNAGFSLFSDSFLGYQNNTTINLTMTTLIIIGGLGFLVIMDIFRHCGNRYRKKVSRLSIHTKLVLTTTAILVVGGMLFFLLIEGPYSLHALPPGSKILASYFQSVTARTAGFRTVDFSHLSNAGYFILMMLMFIGASPGSTGGGIKTSTFATLILSIRSFLRGKEEIEVFGRTIPRQLINKVLAIVSFSLMAVGFFTLLLLLTQSQRFLALLFEEISAFGTVGLSTGITSQLNTVGKTIILSTMLLGRIGPLTMALAIRVQPPQKGTYGYPEERIMIG